MRASSPDGRRPCPIAVEALERRVQFSAWGALPSAVENGLIVDHRTPSAAADEPVAATTQDIEITLEDGTVVTTEPPDSSPIGTTPIIDFGAILRTQQATAKAFLIKNVGVNPLLVGEITVPDGFVLVQQPSGSIQPGASGRIEIALDPTTKGVHVGRVVVASDDPDEPLLSFSISGQVLPPPVSVASVDGRRLPASVVTGRTSPRRPLSVTLRNETDLPFVDSVSIAAYASSDVTLDASDVKLAEFVTALRLPAGHTRMLKLMLSPDAFPVGDAIVIASVTASNVTDAGAGPQVSVRPPFVRLASGSDAGDPRAVTASAKRGRAVPLVIPIANDGNVPTSLTSATFNLEVSPTDGPTAGVVVASTSVATKLRIAPGKTRPVKLAPTFPADAFPAGEYQLRVTVSAEGNQTNDTFAVTIPLQFV
jgi:hypothetical protein